MATNRRSAPKRSSADSARRASLVLEDLLFALKKLDATAIELAVESLRNQNSIYEPADEIGRFQSADPNKHFLIGVLPRLLQDRDLFSSNEDVASFSAEALHFQISRYEKLAREDLIGKIVCRTDKLDDRELADIVRALEKIVGDDERLAEVKARKRSSTFSWNQTIQDVLREG